MKSVKRNFLYNIGYQILVLIMPIATSPYLSRVLGAEKIGIYSYTFSVAFYFVLFAMLGVNNYGNRCVARARGDRAELSRQFWSIWALQWFLSVASSLLYVAYSLMIADDPLVSLIWVPYVLSAGLDVNWLFFGLEEFGTTVGRNFAIKLSTFLIMFIVVRGACALESYCLLMSVSYLVSVAVLWPFLRRHVDVVRPTLREVVSHVVPNLVLFVPVIAVSLYTVLDRIMLGQLSSMEQAGYFENALKVAQMPFAVITALGTVMLPRASNLLASGRRGDAERYLGASMWTVTALSSAFVFGLAGVSDVFAPVFFGEGFRACGPLICVIVLEMPFMAWANVLRTQYLIPADRDRAYVLSVFVGAIVNLCVNVALIPPMGALGAAWGTAAAEIAVCLVQVRSVSGELPQNKWLRECLPFLPIGVIMFVLVRLVGSIMGESAITLVCQIVVGAVFFILISVMWCILSSDRYFKGYVEPEVRRLLARVSFRKRDGNTE